MRVFVKYLLLIVLPVFFQGASWCFGQAKHLKASAQLTDLKVEGQPGWIVTDEPQLRLSWNPVNEKSDNRIAGYEVIAASTDAFAGSGKGDLWNSGFLPATKGPWVLFDASKLPSRSEVWWRVRPVFENSQKGNWSETARFEIGLKNAADWKGKWISMNAVHRQRSAPLFRKNIEITKPVVKARLYVCGLGYHESWLNGKKLGNEVLQPAQTDYNLRCFYVVHDISSQLSKGINTLGLWLGDGFYNQDRVFGANGLSYGQPIVFGQFEVEYADGSKEVVATDESWKCKTSSIVSSNVYAGENFDASIFDNGWATSNALPNGWEPVEVLPSPGGKLIAQQLPPCRKLQTVPAKKVDELRPGTWIFDFGQNLVGWAKLKVDASPGTTITIRFAENRLSDGNLGFASSGIKATKVIQTDVYTCKGGGEETWEPRFTYHGFQFAEVSVSNGKLKDGAPGRDFLEGVVIHTDMEVVGEFECSDPILNKAFELAHWTQIGGIQGVPTDCPIRERCGWTGDAHLVVPYTMLRFDAESMWRKYIEDIVTTAQVTGKMLCFGNQPKERSIQVKEIGIPTMIAPGKRFIGEGSPDWGCAIAFIPWDIYVRTGDDRSLRTHYKSIRQWTEHLQKLSVDGIIYSGMGDWCKPTYKSDIEGREFFGIISPMLSTACYYRSARITADAAKILGQIEDFKIFDALANDIQQAFANAFYSDHPQMIPDQTINAIAINWNILSPEYHEKVAQTLAKQVEEADFHFLTGVFGMPSIWPVLGQFGFHETAWKALHTDSSPGLKYLLKRGATTFWEVWPTENDVDEEYQRSMSHPFQGGFVAWFFEGLAGINLNPEYPGYRQINIEPQFFEELEWVRCRYKSSMGAIESSWKRKGNLLHWTIEIPAGATAQVRIPGKLNSINGEGKDAGTKETNTGDEQKVTKQIVLSSGKYKLISKM